MYTDNNYELDQHSQVFTALLSITLSSNMWSSYLRYEIIKHSNLDLSSHCFSNSFTVSVSISPSPPFPSLWAACLFPQNLILLALISYFDFSEKVQLLVILCHLIWDHIISYHIISKYIISCHTISSHLMSYYNIISSHLISYYNIISCHLISYYIISSQNIL